MVDFHRGQFEMRRKNSFSLLTGARTASRSGLDADGKLMDMLETAHLPCTKGDVQQSVVHHLQYTLAKTKYNTDTQSMYLAAGLSVRDRLVEALHETNEHFAKVDCKRGYYLSLEFLLGRLFQNALVGLDLEEVYSKALEELGYKLEELYEREHDPALGNGGLGRLAACFLDSVATLNLPMWGYGIRYTYGIFEQKIHNGRQVEHPDYWLVHQNPWEIERTDVTYGVRFYGHVKEYKDDKGKQRHKWEGGEIVQAIAYDNPVPGFDTFNCISLRLWRAAPSQEFDFAAFDKGNYLDSVKTRQRAEDISAVLYPNDNSLQGKELRLRQQYFFVCATLQDVLRRFLKHPDRKWEDLPSKVVLQLNDTHPSIAIPEMMRLLVDIQGLDWAQAWQLSKKCFNYTNHTVLPEALEKWPLALMERLLPRHVQIINTINYEFLNQVAQRWGWDNPAIAGMSIYQEGEEKMIRMANLSVIGSTKVNGVAAIHTEIVKKWTFKDFHRWFTETGDKDKFVNMTNGVTPRRWIHCCNRGLSELLSEALGSDEWLKDLALLQGVKSRKADAGFQKKWAAVKLANKQRLAAVLKSTLNLEVDPERMLFDVQVKRMHEYKRQLMNAFFMIHRYLSIKDSHDKSGWLPRFSVVGGKAAPGYRTAKIIIKLINNIAAVVNNDGAVKDLFKVAFFPNYNVSTAQVLIPASDISEHISTAGTEASGTSNMKFVMNGGLIVGTMDGANVEIREEGGHDTMFIFGALETEVDAIKDRARRGDYPIDGRLRRVFEAIKSGMFSLNDSTAHAEFCELVDMMCANGEGRLGDNYLVCHDFPGFLKAQEEVDRRYREPSWWWEHSIQAACSMGQFSTDRTIKQYADTIWHLQPTERPAPVDRMSAPPAQDGNGKAGKKK